MAPDWVRVGSYVAQRRHELGLTQQDIAGRGGPSAATLRKLELGQPKTAYDQGKLARLEKILRWYPGSISSLSEGGEAHPIPLRTVDASNTPTGPMLTLASVAQTAATAWEDQVWNEVRAHGIPALPGGEIGEILRSAWGAFATGDVPPDELVMTANTAPAVAEQGYQQQKSA